MPSEASDHEKRPSATLNEEELAKARTRVSRACTRCRTRKDKCDGAKPRCSNCHSANQTCNYEPATKKRGLPEGYVRGLEKLFALLIGKVDGFEDVTSQLLSDHRAELVKLWNHNVVGEDLHTTWKECKIISELENLLSGLDQTSTITSQKRKRDLDDEGSAVDAEPDLGFHLKPQYNISQIGHAPGLRATAVSNASQSVTPLPKNALGLLDHYFAHTHCWFPVLKRPQITRACYELARGRARSEQQTMAPLLWAIFAYTSSQLYPSEVAGTRQDLLQNEISTAREMQTKSLELMPSNPQEFETVHAQAFLILALSDIGLGYWKSAWAHVGQAVRAVLSEMRSEGSPSSIAPALLQGCAILDTTIASHLDCVPHLRRADVEAVPFMNEDSHEEWEPWNAPYAANGPQREPSFSVSCFNRLTEICLVIGDVLSLQSQSHNYEKTNVQSMLARLHQLQTTFPGAMPPNSQSPPHQIYLQLYHVSAQIRLVELPVTSGAGLNERAKLACNILSLLALCKNTSVIGLQYVPPFMVDGFEAALRLANSSRICFGPHTGLPAFEDFHRTATDFISEMSRTWHVYSGVSDRHQRVLQPPSSISAGAYNMPLSGQANVFSNDRSPLSLAQNSILTNARNGRSSSSHLQGEDRPMLQAEIQFGFPSPNNDFLTRSGNLATDNTILNHLVDTPSHRGSTGIASIGPNEAVLPDNLDFNMTDSDFTGPIGLAMPETSPSFQGDEIDAIFHEMAHLDTNEWTDERALGLKEFGFQDDLTFQAFCNDPDRLLVPPTGPQQTLSSETQTWMFAGAE